VACAARFRLNNLHIIAKKLKRSPRKEELPATFPATPSMAHDVV
jgi:hypothetical protein